MSLTHLKRKIIAALLEDGTGRGIGTGVVKDVTGTEIITEIGNMAWTMGGDGKEKESMKEIERRIVIETVTTASEKITLIAEIGTDIQSEKDTMKTESTVEDVAAVVAPVLECVLPRMMVRGRSPRKERKRKRRRVPGMLQILIIQRL